MNNLETNQKLTRQQQKACSSCGLNKDLESFYRCNYGNGYRGVCKDCFSKYNTEQRRNKERNRYQNNKERIKEVVKNYQKNNKYKVFERRRKYRLENREKVKEQLKKWSNSERGKIIKRLYNQKREKLQKLSDDGTINLENVRKIWTGECKACKGKIIMSAKRGEMYHCHLDHIIPLIKGGKHTISNVQWLCSFCNLSKHDKIWKIN